MVQRISVLIVEDYENDALLCLQALNQGGYSVFFERVETREQFGQALDSQKWDVIIVDQGHGSLGVIVVRELLRSRSLETPLIAVSGQFGEEWAVEAMKAGADDCLRKDRLSQLASIVSRELAASPVRRERPAPTAVREIWRELAQIVARSEQELLLLPDNDRIRPGLEEICIHARHAVKTLSSLLPSA